MSMPGDVLSVTPQTAAFLAPDANERSMLTVDYELAGIALGDPSQGNQVQQWRGRVSGADVVVAPSPFTSETVVYTEAGISELSICFDQNMRATLAFVVAGVAKLYWYDSFVASMTTTVLEAGVTSPFLTLDDKRTNATLTNRNDMLLYYILNGKLCYRQQRDRFLVERELCDVPAGVRITRCGMHEAGRVQIEMVAQ